MDLVFNITKIIRIRDVKMGGELYRAAHKQLTLRVTGILKNASNRWGNANEFRYYCRGLPTRTIATIVRRTERTVRDWISGNRPTPAWAVELVRLRELERQHVLQQITGRQIDA